MSVETESYFSSGCVTVPRERGPRVVCASQRLHGHCIRNSWRPPPPPLALCLPIIGSELAELSTVGRMDLICEPVCSTVYCSVWMCFCSHSGAMYFVSIQIISYLWGLISIFMLLWSNLSENIFTCQVGVLINSQISQRILLFSLLSIIINKICILYSLSM